MQRHSGLPARENYDARLAERGFIDDPNDRYWQETCAYEFTEAQIDELHDAAKDVHRLCIDAAQAVIDRDLFFRFGIPEQWKEYIIKTWERNDPTIYARFDFAYNGVDAPKMLEYNADTPTALLEASVLQWDWLQDNELPDQYNCMHEDLIKAWQRANDRYNIPQPLYFTTDHQHNEDRLTTEYMRDTAMQAGLETAEINLANIGWNEARDCFVDMDENHIAAMFKLYPWEFMIHDDFAKHAMADHTGFIEPAWKMLLSNKALLPLLWEIAPNHPNLLESHHSAEPFGDNPYVKKALLGREGASVTIVHPEHGATAEGPYGEEGYVYQEYCELPEFDGRYPVCGIWMIDGEPSGMGIREDKQRITQDSSDFVPHFFRPATP